MGSDDTISGRVKDPVVTLVRWVKSRTPRVKTFLGSIAGLLVSALLTTHLQTAMTVSILQHSEDPLGRCTPNLYAGLFHITTPHHLQAILVLWKTIEDHDTLFVLAEVVHFLGIGVLAYKLQTKRSIAGL